MILGNEMLPLQIEVMLPADWTFLAIFHPLEDALRVELMLAVQHVFAVSMLHIVQTDRTLELLLVNDRLFSIFLPGRVYHVFVPTAEIATNLAALNHPHNAPPTSAFRAFYLFTLQILLEDPSLGQRQRLLRVHPFELLPFFLPYFEVCP